jgi:CheY-like chemotaxis protein
VRRQPPFSATWHVVRINTDAQAKILVVDDEPDVVRLVVKVMKSRGHQAATASSGPEAFAQIHRDPPDVIIVDLDLPRMDGMAVCRQIKSDETTSHIPVIMMMAGQVSAEDAQRAIAMGVDEFLAKPFLRDVLIHNVERLLGDRSLLTG